MAPPADLLHLPAEIPRAHVGSESNASPQVGVLPLFPKGTPLRNEIEARDASRLKEATKHVAEALARRFGSGPIEGRIRAFVITAIS